MPFYKPLLTYLPSLCLVWPQGPVIFFSFGYMQCTMKPSCICYNFILPFSPYNNNMAWFSVYSAYKWKSNENILTGPIGVLCYLDVKFVWNTWYSKKPEVGCWCVIPHLPKSKSLNCPDAVTVMLNFHSLHETLRTVLLLINCNLLHRVHVYTFLIVTPWTWAHMILQINLLLQLKLMLPLDTKHNTVITVSYHITWCNLVHVYSCIHCINNKLLQNDHDTCTCNCCRLGGVMFTSV